MVLSGLSRRAASADFSAANWVQRRIDSHDSLNRRPVGTDFSGSTDDTITNTKPEPVALLEGESR
jgi:hypothetical protein